ncbi:MAG TPA: hypothetical protein DC013_02585 [Ruminococcaceae bacterium]|jgi:hypothetical protein|nr:hypothetical protein [Oscillospiraceae bacterium]
MEKYKGTMIEATCEPPIRNFPLRQGKNSFRIPRILDAGRHNSSQNAEIDQSLVFSNEVREKAAEKNRRMRAWNQSTIPKIQKGKSGSTHPLFPSHFRIRDV